MDCEATWFTLLHTHTEPPKPVTNIVCGCITVGSNVLLCQRSDNKGWCHPGGKVDPRDKSLQHALHRELDEELNIQVYHTHHFSTILHINSIFFGYLHGMDAYVSIPRTYVTYGAHTRRLLHSKDYYRQTQQ